MKKFNLFLVMSIFLIGCGEKIYSVEEFINDRQLRSKYLKKCLEEQGIFRSRNCKNLSKAFFSSEIKIFPDTYEEWKEWLNEYDSEK